jgi:hypothetical protein
MAVATEREYGLFIKGFGRELGIDTLEDYLETKSVLVSTSPKPINPFGL